MTEKEVLVKNLKINYKMFGSGDPLLILHGWPSSSDRWQQVSELLSQKFLVIVPDLPGFGKSELPKVSWSLDNYVEWLLEFSNVVPELKNGFYLLGHSFGGALASKFAIRHNQKVKKLFLISASCIRKNTFIKKVIYRISKVVKVFQFVPFYSLFRKAVYKFIIRRSDYPYQNDTIKETYLRIISEDLSYKLGFLKVPVVIIWGDKDVSTPIDQAHFINKKIYHSKLIIIPGAEHALNTKVPEVLSQNILSNS